jgi:hypothetical protein
MRDSGGSAEHLGQVIRKEYSFESPKRIVYIDRINTVHVNSDLCGFYSRRDGMYIYLDGGAVRDVKLNFPCSDLNCSQKKYISGFDVIFDGGQFAMSSRENNFIIPLMCVSRTLDGSKLTLNANDYSFRDPIVAESLRMAYDFLSRFADEEKGIYSEIRSRVNERSYNVLFNFPEISNISEGSLEKRLA